VRTSNPLNGTIFLPKIDNKKAPVIGGKIANCGYYPILI